MLFLLVTVPALVLVYLLIQRRRRRLADFYGGLGMARDDGRGLAWRRHVPPAFFLLSLAALIVGLARPQAQVSLPRLEGTVILAFDVSGSMSADDLKPTRLDAAKSAAQEFVQAQPLTVQIGVVAFSDTGFSVQPPTNDQASVLAAIQRLEPTRGTSLANGIYDALTVIAISISPPAPSYYTALTPAPIPSPTPVPAGTYTPAVIILLTDGENNENPDPLAAAQAAAQRGVRIHTIGLGSAAGTTVHVNGFTVHTQLDEARPEADLPDYRRHLLQRNRCTGTAQDLRRHRPPDGRQTAEDGSHFPLCGSWNFGPALGGRFLSSLVWPPAVILRPGRRILEVKCRGFGLNCSICSC